MIWTKIFMASLLAIVVLAKPANAEPLEWSFHGTKDGKLTVFGTRKTLGGKIEKIQPPVLDVPAYTASTTLKGLFASCSG